MAEVEACKSIQSYWRRRSYRRVEGAKKTDGRTITLGGGSENLRKPIVVAKKVKVPGLLEKLRDSYLGAMFSWSGEKPAAAKKSGRRKVKDFDRRMTLHIYNTVVENPKQLAITS